MKTTIIVILALLVIGGGIYAYQVRDKGTYTGGTNEPDNVFCTMDAKLCPDGSYVGRQGPNCEFAACPGATTTPTSTTP